MNLVALWSVLGQVSEKVSAREKLAAIIQGLLEKNHMTNAKPTFHGGILS